MNLQEQINKAKPKIEKMVEAFKNEYPNELFTVSVTLWQDDDFQVQLFSHIFDDSQEKEMKKENYKTTLVQYYDRKCQNNFLRLPDKKTTHTK